MTAESQLGITRPDLGGNTFVFTGAGVSITYYPVRPGPMVNGQEPGPELTYQGPEGTKTFGGQEIGQTDCPLGTLLTVPLQVNVGAGGHAITVVVPKAFGVGEEAPVRYSTVAIKTASRGNIERPGVQLTYEVLPLVGEAEVVMMPLQSGDSAS
jgi:hypothetical protein